MTIGEITSAAIILSKALGCCAIILLASWKRSRPHSIRSTEPHPFESIAAIRDFNALSNPQKQDLLDRVRPH
jgi:hypothetical protein